MVVPRLFSPGVQPSILSGVLLRGRDPDHRASRFRGSARENPATRHEACRHDGDIPRGSRDPGDIDCRHSHGNAPGRETMGRHQ